MNNFSKKKLIGTGLLAFAIFGVAATGYSITQAQFIAQGGDLKVDGVVSAINTTQKTVTVTTNDSSPITFQVTGETKFTPSGTNSLSDISVGDGVSIQGNKDNHANRYIAIKIKRNGVGPGYGTNGNRVFVTQGKVTDINTADSNFTVKFGTTYVNFEVHITTVFKGKTYAKLKVGDTVEVTGEDTGSYFLADKVVVGGGNSNDGHDDNGHNGDH